MAGILDRLMSGYTERVLGPDSGAAKNNAAIQTATAYQNLQDAIAADYGQQKQMFESDPINKGKAWNAPDTAERFQDQIHAMILSGDPALQQRALNLIDQPKGDETTNLEKTAKLLNLDPMTVFQMLHPGPSQTNVSVNLPKMDQPMTLEDLQKLQLPNGMPVPIGTTMREAGGMGAQVGQTKEQAEKGAASETSVSAIKQLGDNIDPTSNTKDTVLETLRTMPGVIGQVTSVAAGAAGIPANPKAVKFNQAQQQASSQMLKILSGASATDDEFNRIRNLYPQITDDPVTRRIKYNSMLDQTQAIVDRARSQGVTGLPDISKVPRLKVNTQNAPKAPESPSAPKATKRFNPDTGRIEEIK